MPPRKRTWLFFLVNLLMCSWFLDHTPNDNTMSRALAVSQAVDHQTLEITPQQHLTGDKARIGDRYYSDKAPLPAYLVIPVWWVLRAADVVHAADGEGRFGTLLRVGGLICGACPLAVIITLIWLAIRARNPGRERWAIALAMLPIYGSFLFVYSGSFFGHLTGAVFMLLALVLMDRGHDRLAGLCAGAAVLSEYPLAVFPALWILVLLLMGRYQRSVHMMIGGAPAVLLLILNNAAISGDPFSVGYQHETNYAFMDHHLGFGRPTMQAFWGLSIGTYRGLFVYMPVALLCALVGVRHMRRAGSMRWQGLWPSLFVSYLLIAAYGMWWGGWSYGPRHLTTLAVLLAYRGLPLIAAHAWSRWSAMLLGAVGLLFAFAAKATFWYSLPSEHRSPMNEVILPAFLNGPWDDATWLSPLHLPAWISNGAFLLFLGLGIFALMRTERSATPA